MTKHERKGKVVDKCVLPVNTVKLTWGWEQLILEPGSRCNKPGLVIVLDVENLSRGGGKQ